MAAQNDRAHAPAAGLEKLGFNFLGILSFFSTKTDVAKQDSVTQNI